MLFTFSETSGLFTRILFYENYSTDKGRIDIGYKDLLSVTSTFLKKKLPGNSVSLSSEVNDP